MSVHELKVEGLMEAPLTAIKTIISDPASIIPHRWGSEMESILGALFIIFGIVLKNSMEQTGREGPNRSNWSALGIALFVAGWAMFADAVSKNATNTLAGGDNQLMPFLGAAVVVGAVMLMKAAMKKYKADGSIMTQKMRPLILAFVAGWLLFAYSIGQNLGLAFLSALLVFASMLYFLPLQRKHGVVDGPGMPLFVIAWFGLIVANSTPVARALLG